MLKFLHVYEYINTGGKFSNIGGGRRAWPPFLLPSQKKERVNRSRETKLLRERGKLHRILCETWVTCCSTLNNPKNGTPVNLRPGYM